jgi:L-rhamnose isomerase
MAHAKLRDAADVDPKLFAGWLRWARKLELGT